MSASMSTTARTIPSYSAARTGCEGCLEQSASTSYGSQFTAGYFQPVQSQFAGFRGRWGGAGSSERGFSCNNGAGQGTFNAQGAFCIVGLDWGREAKRRGIARCGEEARARLLGFRQPVVSLRAGCNGGRLYASGGAETGAGGPKGLGGFREGLGGMRTRLGGSRTNVDTFRRVWTSPGDAAGKARTRFQPTAWSKSDEVAAPSVEDIDLDSLDLTDEKSSDIIRAAKIAQLQQMDYEELQQLPRRERLIPKKRAPGKTNPFLRLGDPKKLELIRDTLRPKTKSAKDESEDEEGALDEEEVLAEKGIDYNLAALLQKDTLDVDPLSPKRRRKKYSIVTGQYASDRIAELKAAGLLPKKSARQEATENKMRERPKAMQTRKSVLAEHFAAHQGSAQAMIRKVMRLWEEGVLKPDTKKTRMDEEAHEDLEYGLSYDDSRLHVPFRFGPSDAFQELLALRPEERPKFFHQGFLDALEHESAVAKLEAFKEEFYKTLIKRAQAVNSYCETLSETDFGLDCSSLDMAVYLTRFLTRNYKDPEDIRAIRASVEDRIDFLQERLHISREMVITLLISYPRYFSPFCDLERRVDGVLMVLERLDYDRESMIKLVFRNPSIFNNPVQRIADNIKVLQALGLAEPEFATKVPWLLGMNLMKRLAERVILLRKYGISDAEMPVCFQRNLPLFLTTVELCDQRLAYMQRLGRGKDWLRSLVISRPKVVCCHLERQVRRVRESLKKVGLERPEAELVDLIVVNSPLYQMSCKKIDEGMAYFTKELGLSPEIFLEFPQAVGYSLEGRTRPRVKICQSLGLVIADKGQPGLSLAQILVTTFPTFKYCIESGVWLRKYGGHVKQLEYDETGKVLAGLAEAEADYLDDDSVEVEIDLPEISGQT